MIVKHQIKMDLAQRGITQRIAAVQGDSDTRVVEITLYANGSPWVVPEGASILLRFRKPDGTGGLYDTLPDGTQAWSVTDNVVCFTLAAQVLAVPGLVQAQLEIVLDSAMLASFAFHVTVDPDPSDGAVASEDYFSWNAWAKKALAEETARVREIADEAAGSAKQAESWAVGGTGTRDGEDTNNAQYWADQARKNTDPANLIDAHNADTAAHEDIRELVPSIVTAHNTNTSAHPDVRAALNALEAELQVLDLKYITDITENTFTVTVGDLGDVVVTGVWNADLARIEF